MSPPYPYVLVLVLVLGCGDDDDVIDEPDANVGYVEILPEETVDEDALRGMTNWRALPSRNQFIYTMQSSADRGTGETFDISLLENGNRDMNWFVCEGREAFAFGNGLVPFEFDLEECPEDYVKGYVVARFGGPGVMSRFFMTMFSIESGEPPLTEVFRVYVDDEEQPLIQVRLADVLDGSTSELFAPPFGKADPTHVAWYYPVAFDTRLIVTLDEITGANLVYHQTSVTHNDTGHLVSPTRLDLRDDAIALLNSDRPVTVPALVGPSVIDIPAGETATVASLVGPATIHTLAVDSLPADVSIRITWDGAGEAAIDVPLEALFGAWHVPSTERSLALDGLELRLPMPFHSSATIELINNGVSDAAITFTATAEAEARPASLQLHAVASETLGSAAEHPVLSVTGAGRFVGACFALEGHAGDNYGAFTDGFNFLEGDERFLIDGFDAVPGTGTEDYLNSSFYFSSGPFGTPFAQTWAIDGDADTASVSSCRWHVLGDTIDFYKSLEFNLEVGPGDPDLIDRYRSIAFVYR